MTSPKFNGSDYIPERDDPRLSNQHGRIKQLMGDGAWRTLREISEATGDPEASISAQLRHLRKFRFGSWIVRKQNRGDPEQGLFEYRLLASHDPEVTDDEKLESVEYNQERTKALEFPEIIYALFSTDDSREHLYFLTKQHAMQYKLENKVGGLIHKISRWDKNEQH